jgi:hypothetical protein
MNRPTMSSNKTTKEAVKARKEKGIKSMEKVMSLIKASVDGKSTAELTKGTGLSRDRIHSICRKRIDEGDLYKTGRYGKYRLTPKALGDPSMKGFFFDSKIMKTLPATQYLSADNKFCKTPYIQGILKQNLGDDDNDDSKKHALERDSNIKDKLCLFEFALNIGAIVTFDMLMGIKFASDCSEPSIKDKVAWKWIDNVIHPSVILARFADIPEIERRLKRISTNQRPYSFYDMDSKEVESLMLSFQDVFPEVYQKSEEILSGLQNRIDSERRHVKERFDRENERLKIKTGPKSKIKPKARA